MTPDEGAGDADGTPGGATAAVLAAFARLEAVAEWGDHEPWLDADDAVGRMLERVVERLEREISAAELLALDAALRALARHLRGARPPGRRERGPSGRLRPPLGPR